MFGLVSIALAVRLFQDVTRSQSVDELEREAAGLADLYAEAALRSSDEGAKAPEFAAETLELATGDELFYVGAPLFPGQRVRAQAALARTDARRRRARTAIAS